MLYNILGIPDVAPAVWRNVPKAEGDSPKRVYRVIRSLCADSEKDSV